jgi:hypothetical protein
LLLLALLVAAARPAWSREDNPPETSLPAPAFPKPVVGERLAFTGRWMGVPVGYGWIEVKELVEIDGRQAYHIEAQGHTNDVLSAFYPIHDVLHSYVDAETLAPLRFEKHQREGRYKSDEIVTFDQAGRRAHYKSLLNQSEKTIDLPDRFQDLISALYWFRGQPMTPGAPMSVNLYTDEKIYPTEIILRGPEALELLKRGTFRCLIAEPKATFKGLLVKRGRIWAYFTADAYRVPILVKATTPWGAMSAVIAEESLHGARQ